MNIDKILIDLNVRIFSCEQQKQPLCPSLPIRREKFLAKRICPMSNILNHKRYTQNEINEQRRNDTAGRCSTQSSVEGDKTFV